jgi:hypothetical protein
MLQKIGFAVKLGSFLLEAAALTMLLAITVSFVVGLVQDVEVGDVFSGFFTPWKLASFYVISIGLILTWQLVRRSRSNKGRG